MFPLIQGRQDLIKGGRKVLQEAKVAILYLGSRGAGVKFTNFLANELPSHGITTDLIARQNLFKQNECHNFYQIHTHKYRIIAAIGIGKRRFASQMMKIIQEDKIRILIIPMAHPWDLSLQGKLQKHGVKIIRIIHDSSTHPGEIWPRSKDIKKMCKADAIITLSTFTSSQLFNFEHKMFKSYHPNFYKHSLRKINDKSKFEGSYDLIIGRLKRYQNTKVIVKWWVNLPSEMKQNRTLIVAGNLNRLTRILLRKSKGVIFKDNWLSDDDFTEILANANRVICIYKEASQSGIVSAAQGLMVPVLANEIGGIPEQIQISGGGVVASYNSELDWQLKYQAINEGLIQQRTNKDVNQIFVKKIIDALSFVV